MSIFKTTMTTMLLSALFVGCGSSQQAENLIEATTPEIVDGKVTPEVLSAFGRINEAVASPDGKTVIFTVGYQSIPENASNAEIYSMNIDGSNLKRLTFTAGSEHNLQWIEDGNRIAYIAKDKETGNPQIFFANPDGSNVRRMSQEERGVMCFVVSPDSKKIVYATTIDAQNRDPKLFEGLDKTSGRVVDDLMYKHWDEWVEDYPHPFVGDITESGIANAIDIMEGEPYECPMKPHSGAESFSWSPDGKTLAYSCRKLAGKEYAFSTDSNIYLYNLETKKTENLTPDIPGYDTNPVFSPDGSKLAWLSMATAKYESDKKRLMILDMKTRERKDLTENWDYWPEDLAWDADGKSIVFSGYKDGTRPIFRMNVATSELKTEAEGLWDYVSPQPISGGAILALRHCMQRPNEVCVANNGEVNDISSINKDLLSKLKLGKVEKKMIPTTDGKEMLTWVILPPDFDPNKKYPTILYCQGGPQSAVSQNWSYRWNFMIMAANGYVIIAPNRRGVPGFGTEWNRQISGDYGGQNMKDYLTAVDYMKNESYVDADHIGAVGASYGGFSVYWLAGHHENRFAAFIAHAGIFNVEAQYLETEEMWFADFDLGGPYWDTQNAVAQRSYANSPHKFIEKWNTPILVTVGELDYRILASQGMMAFNAAKMRGLDAEMLVFPDENHWVVKPQNAVLWQRVFFNFLDKYLKPAQETAEKK